MVMAHPGLGPQPGIWGILLGLRGRVVRYLFQGGKPGTGKIHSSYIGMNVCWHVCYGSGSSTIIYV